MNLANSRLFYRHFIQRPKLRRFVTRLIEGDKDIVVDLFGAPVTLNTVKEHGYLRASRSLQKVSLLRDELPVLMNLAQLLADGDTFVDIGANVGLFTCLLARRGLLYPGRNRFYALEANPDTFSRLSRSVASLGVTLFPFAASDKDGELEFVAGAASGVFTTSDRQTSANIAEERIRIPCRRLDGLELAGDRLVIKIDVEGQERSVIDGTSGLFAANRVKVVYFDGFADRSLFDYLSGLGFRLLDGRSAQPATRETYSLLAIKD